MDELRSPVVITIPSTDPAFRTHVTRVRAGGITAAPELERRLRQIFPRVIVRERSLSGVPPAWYVYRDGGWRSPSKGEWWKAEGLPCVRVSPEGWLLEATSTAAGLLGIDGDDVASHHFTDFVVPGTLEDWLALFRVVEQGSELDATVKLRPLSGDVIAVDLHTAREGDHVVGVFRLADDVDVVAADVNVPAPGSVETVPPTDVAFRGYVTRALRRMPEPTPDGLELRLRRLYPHASIRVDGDAWIAQRDPEAAAEGIAAWWRDEGLARIRYDAQALILEANDAAKRFFGHELQGHHWQEFVTPGSTEQVAVMLEILAEVGAAESRFRMPRADGALIEFDSYTMAQGDEFTTLIRPVRAQAPDG
jgi:PAS domain-containing protein